MKAILSILIPSLLLLLSNNPFSNACEFPHWLLRSDRDHSDHSGRQSPELNGGSKRQWNGRIKEQLTEFSLMVEVTRKTFRLWSVDATGDVDGLVSVTRVCATRIPASSSDKRNASDANRRRHHYRDRRQTQREHRRAFGEDVGSVIDKFLVVHEEADQTSLRFSCVQFLRRGSDAFQLKSTAKPGVEMDKEVLCSEKNMKLDPWLFVDRENFGGREARIGWFGVEGSEFKSWQVGC